MKLIIKQSSWSGWKTLSQGDHNPQEIENEYDVKLDEKYIIKTMEITHKIDGEWVKDTEEILSFIITEINASNIKIHTCQPFSNRDGDKINLNSSATDFIVEMDKPLRLVTPTMDAGYIFIFTLVEKGDINK